VQGMKELLNLASPEELQILEKPQVRRFYDS
jgi:hypothetical protein